MSLSPPVPHIRCSLEEPCVGDIGHVVYRDPNRSLPVELDGTSSSVDMLASSWHGDRRRYERVEDGKMSGRLL